MANRYPLVINQANLQIQEIASGDNLNLLNNGIVNSGNIVPSANATFDLGSSGFYWNTIFSSSQSVSGNITAGTISATGNVSGDYFIGNGRFLTGIDTTLISNGSSEVRTLEDSDVVISPAGTPNVVVISDSGMSLVGNLSVTGNVDVTGNLNYENVTNLVVGDPLIYLGANNISDTYDLGFTVSYNDGLQQYGGFARDASDGVWKIFGNVTTDPTTTIPFNEAIYQPLQIAALTATTGAFSGNISASYFSGNGSTLSGVDSFGTILVSGQSNVIADTTSDSLTFAGTSNITITTDAANSIITFDTAYTVWVNGGNLGLVSVAHTDSYDFGNVIASATTEYDLGLLTPTPGPIDGATILANTITGAQLASNITIETSGEIDTTGNLAVTGTIQAARLITVPGTVSELPSAVVSGMGSRGFVTDANSTNFASIVVGGGANAVPVYSDGTNWRIG